MTYVVQPGLMQQIVALVADTFDVPMTSVTSETHPEEVNGWDSLGHSVLLTRIERRFNVTVTEDLATFVVSIGELANRLSNAIERERHA